MAWLDDHPPARSQFRRPRRQRPSGVVVVHTAENTPDLVAFDGGAEAVANFIRGRSDPGSYHDLVDSDSAINLVDYGNEAYHDGTGSNPHSYGVSVATRADVWPLAPQAWRDGAVRQAAAAARRYAAWVKGRYGIVIPARRITRSESERGVPGFLGHGERDPGRRYDPGVWFPWTQFLAAFAGTPLPTTPEDDMPLNEDDQNWLRKLVMDSEARQNTLLSGLIAAQRDGIPVLVKGTGRYLDGSTAPGNHAAKWWAVSAEGAEHIQSRDRANTLIVSGLLRADAENGPFLWSQDQIDAQLDPGQLPAPA